MNVTALISITSSETRHLARLSAILKRDEEKQEKIMQALLKAAAAQEKKKKRVGPTAGHRSRGWLSRQLNPYGAQASYEHGLRCQLRRKRLSGRRTVSTSSERGRRSARGAALSPEQRELEQGCEVPFQG